MGVDESRDIRELVREYYGETLQGSDDLKTDACCCTAHTPPKYVIDVMNEIDDEIMAHFYGCGSPIPPALEGATVLDLGCGTGRDVYICSKLVEMCIRDSPSTGCACAPAPTRRSPSA